MVSPRTNQHTVAHNHKSDLQNNFNRRQAHIPICRTIAVLPHLLVPTVATSLRRRKCVWVDPTVILWCTQSALRFPMMISITNLGRSHQRRYLARTVRPARHVLLALLGGAQVKKLMPSKSQCHVSNLAPWLRPSCQIPLSRVIKPTMFVSPLP